MPPRESSARRSTIFSTETSSSRRYSSWTSATDHLESSAGGSRRQSAATAKPSHVEFSNNVSVIDPLEASRQLAGFTEKPNYVSFGTTQARPVFPTAMPPTRFGNEIKPIRGQPNTGPGAYENEQQTNFQYKTDHYLTSSKGYTMGARTGPRFRKEFIEMTPAPHQYQTTCTELRTFDPAYEPFNFAAERFPITKRDVEEATPGPGNYDHDITRNRRVQWHQSFGGGPIKLPDVNIKSTIGSNTSKLLSTRDAKKHNRRLAYLKLYWE